MIVFSFSLIVNYPKFLDQKERIDAHAKEASMMASILFAGVFIGILKETGMITAMADAVVSLYQNPRKIYPDNSGDYIYS